MRHVLAKTRWISHSVIGRHGSIADVSNSTLGVCLAYVIISFKLTSETTVPEDLRHRSKVTNGP